MKVVGLLSGGKDSCFNLCHCVRQGHEIVAVATLAPPSGKDEIDSYMYQTVGHDAVHLVAQALDVPLYRKSIKGQPLNQDLQYRQASTSASAATAATDETEDLFDLLLEVKRNHPDVEGVSVGAILSNYQRTRVEHVALRPELQLVPLTYLWQRSQDELLAEMVNAGVNAVLIKVAGIGLDERDLGKSLAQMQPKLRRLNSMYGAHVCGEGGEYETLTLDCPLFKHSIELVETEIVTHAEAAFASVAYLKIAKAQLVPKTNDAAKLDTVQVPDDLDVAGRRTLKAIQGAALPSSTTASIAASSSLADINSTTGKPRPSHIKRSGQWLHLSNVHGLSEEGNRPESLEQETEDMFKQLQRMSLRNVTHVNLYLSSQSDFLRVNAVYKRQFQEGPPSRACVGIRVAKGDIRRVSLDAAAIERPEDQRSLHVQGRSYWAPANIGPYSQAMLARERISIAGQIGLRPADLSLPTGDYDLQCALALQHARRIYLAVLDGAAVSISDAIVEGGICWIENLEEGSGAPLLGRVVKAQVAWARQSQLSAETIGQEDTTGEDGDEEEDNFATSWLGGHRQAAALHLPMLYAVVPFRGLPRGAGIEWQLTACTGRRATTRTVEATDEDDNDMDPAAVQTLERGSVDVFDLDGTFLRLRWSSLHRSRSESSFGIMSIEELSEAQSSASLNRANQETFEALKTRLADALSIRAFISGAGGAGEGSLSLASRVLGVLDSHGKDADLVQRTTVVPVDALFVGSGGPDSLPLAVPIAFVWAGVPRG
ncbi:hypothetical protein OC835_001841 [Tilletia horrida]|nr:hypothetical protein OC835_001841 [Tilletia horrida]